jgi:sugar/nucleoside kinase (ribokinase family)
VITVVGSIAFDAIKTPFAEGERVLGGAAVHFALAASFFDRVHVVGRVGNDFTDEELAVLTRRGIDTSGIERVTDGETFFWRGEYGFDMATRTTHETRLGVFADFNPTLSEQARQAELLFLANIQPTLQRQVRAQVRSPRFTALDSMNIWIREQRDELLAAIAQVDCLIINDGELRELTGRPSLYSAAQAVFALGPGVVVCKQGEYGAALYTKDGEFFALPAYPLEQVIDPTGAGDTFAGGFIGYLAGHPQRRIDTALLREALACGIAVASFNVEGLGTERLQTLEAGELRQRYEDLARFTSFSPAPLPLREPVPAEG